MKHFRKLVLANGFEIHGVAEGNDIDILGEIVVNTSCIGYQSIASDPYYADKIVLLTYPLIGNYGINQEDELKTVYPRAFIVREYNDHPSNFRSIKTFLELLEENKRTILSELDTREVAKILRDNGSMVGLITDSNRPLAECLEIIKNYKEQENITSQVSTKKRWSSKIPNSKHHVGIIDLGVNRELINTLNKQKCNVTVFPNNTKGEEILIHGLDGIVISNGPGEPNSMVNEQRLIKDLLGKLPILGIGIGGILFAIVVGNEVKKLTYGYHGINLPVRDCTGKCFITNQNINYVPINSAGDKEKNYDLNITHVNVGTGDIAAMECKSLHANIINYYPEANDRILKSFLENMGKKEKYYA